MKRIFFFFALIAFASCSNSEQKPSAVINPQELYLKKCASCHGEQGDLTMGGAKKIKETQMTKEQIALQISEGKGTMPRFGDRLTKEEIDALSVYCLKLAGK
jgi:mono/diheme cytochrome c family protein